MASSIDIHWQGHPRHGQYGELASDKEDVEYDSDGNEEGNKRITFSEVLGIVNTNVQGMYCDLTRQQRLRRATLALEIPREAYMSRLGRNQTVLIPECLSFGKNV